MKILCICFLIISSAWAMDQKCIQCHTQEAHKWQTSHHYHSMDTATSKNVLGDFNNKKVTIEGLLTHFTTKNNKFFCKTEDADGKIKNFEISHVFGVEPLQQYLVQYKNPSKYTPSGNIQPHIQVLPFCWDTEKKEWYHLYAHDLPPPGDVLHWTNWAQNWNHMCADCHVTHYDKGYDFKNNTYNSTYSVGRVSCSACHTEHDCHKDTENPKTVKDFPKSLISFEKQKREMNFCAPCHARREHLKTGYRPHKDFEDYYRLTFLDQEIYHHDGQIKDEVYVMGSFLQSKMYRHGVTCSNCHDPHSLKLKLPGHQVCSQCHDPKLYDTPKHHYHLKGSTGSSCLECHMPESTYMTVDYRRDHSIRIPRPDLSQKIGAPNACTGCHIQEERKHQHRDYQNLLTKAQVEGSETQSLLKAMDQAMTVAFKKWTNNKYENKPHYGEVFHAARTGQLEDYEDLIKIAGNTMDYGPITRATALSLVNLSPKPIHPSKIIPFVTHEDPLLRRAAVSQNIFLQYPQVLSASIKDTTLSVRFDAFRNLLQSYDSNQPKALRKDILNMKHELEDYLTTNGDQSGAHILMAGIQNILGEIDNAEASYRLAIRQQPELSGVRPSLAQILDDKKQSNEAKELRLEEIEILQRDLGLSPNLPNIWYRLGIMYYSTQNVPEAINAMKMTLKLQPDNYNAGIFVIQLNERQHNWGEVLKASQSLLRHYPNDRYLHQVFEQAKNRR